MKQIANFYTWFWVIYFPTCIAFYDVGPTKWVDEIMTIILMGYTFMNYNKRSIVKEPKKEYKQYLYILAFFVIYGLLFGANVQIAVLRDMVQWIRPFSIIYCTWILNPQFSRRQKNRMIVSMIISTIAVLFYNMDVITKNEIEFATLGQMSIVTGMAYYLFSDDTKKNRYIALMLVLIGMLAPKFKFLGEVVCFIYFIFFMKNKLNFKSSKTITALAMLMAVIIYVTWEKFDAYYISGFAEGAKRVARPESYRIAFTEIIWEYFPFGSGMGSWGCAAAADYYSPLLYKYKMNEVWGCSPDFTDFIADAFFPTLCQFGVVGIFFFCVFWKRRLQAFNAIKDRRYYRVAWITFFCLFIEQTADTSFLSGKGMGYCMFIALCLNANRNMMKEENGILRKAI